MEKLNTLEELRERLRPLAKEIRAIQKACGYDRNEDVSELAPARKDAETFFLLDELRGVLYRLDQAAGDMEYLEGKVVADGILTKSPSGKYALSGWPKLSCGSAVEVLVEDDYHDALIDGEYQRIPYWCAGRLEHNGSDYYFTGNKEMLLDGARARIRR